MSLWMGERGSTGVMVDMVDAGPNGANISIAGLDMRQGTQMGDFIIIES